MTTSVLLSGARPFFSFDKRLYFVLLCCCNALVIYISNEFLLTDDLYYQTYGERVAIERIDEYLEFRRQTWWMSYVFTPLTLVIKLCFVAVCLNIGTLMAGMKSSFGKLFKIALVAETIFIASNLLRICWLAFIADVSVMDDIQYFYPLSLINFFDAGSIESWYAYPLVTVNAFEILYFLSLALGIHWLFDREYRKSLKLVVASYGTGLIVWMIFIVFLSINLT